MKSSLLLIAVGLFFVSCTKEQPLEFSNVNYERTSELNEGNEQAKVNISIPSALTGTVVADSINTSIYNFIESVINFGEGERRFSSYEELADSFIASYNEVQKDFPESIGWEANMKGKIIFQTENLLNIKIEYYIFTGGAHGYFGMKSLLFDIRNGKSLTHQDLFMDLAKLERYVEEQFRKYFQIGENQSINATGFMFEDDTFHLPENIFFTDEGLLFHYNVYEISSYADGYQTFVISYDQVDLFLKKDYKPSFAKL